MKAPIIAVLAAAICGVVIPINGQSTREDASRNHAQSQSAAKPEAQSASPSVSVVNQQTSTEQSNRPKSEPQGYLKRLVAAENLPNLILCGVGIAGIGVAICTLLIIRRQTNALVDSERAWIRVEIGKLPDYTPNTQRLEMLWLFPDVTNVGKTVARIKRVVARVELVPDGQQLPTDPTYPPGQGVDYSLDFMLAPNVPVRPIKLGITGWEFAEVQKSKQFLYVHGFIKYLDLGKTERHSGFCFYYAIQRGFDPSPTAFYFHLVAPPAYTQCT